MSDILTSLKKSEFLPFKLSAIQELTPNTKRFTFELASTEHSLGLTVSSLVMAKLHDPATGQDIVRPYTPVSVVDKKGSFDMVIKVTFIR
jgi:cytochrome-b5 reductase